MEDEMAGLTLDSGEDDVLQFAPDSAVPSVSFVHCFVGKSTVIGAGALITNQHSGQDFSRMMGPFDENMGVDSEDSPISQAEGLKRPFSIK
ncbi:hypothetical protein V6N11_028795 [Hibiscus sabdariffa]|uniref:Uncharacterized protein n=1 Tax=Hibiscus sabdariffa TaxID=183260 RepID=A0ABR2PQV4_9ROSI